MHCFWYRRLPILVIVALIGTIPVFEGDPFAAHAYARGARNGTPNRLPPLPPPTVTSGPPTPLPPPPVPVPIQPEADPHLPSLVLDITVDPPVLHLGDTATVSVTVFNQAPDPAEDLVVTMAVPDGATPIPDGNTTPTGWSWTLGHLDAGTETVVTARLQITSQPANGGLLCQVDALAQGLTDPVSVSGGALVVDPHQAPATATFTPGTSTVLQSPDGSIAVEIPGDASDQPLSLSLLPPGSDGVSDTSNTRTTLFLPSIFVNASASAAVASSAPQAVAPVLGVQSVVQSSRAQSTQQAMTLPPGETVPPEIAGVKRGFGTFYLSARDANNTVIHQFDAPLTIHFHYTPEQLAALATSASDLALFWFDTSQQVWVPLPTAVDLATQTVTVSVDHFSAFQFANGSSASASYIPSLQPFQTNLFTGANAFTYPIEVPTGPGGVKPDVALHYGSADTDGTTGMNIRHQAGWAGKGWSLTTGAIAANKQLVNAGTERSVVYYTLTLNGMAVDLVGSATVANADRTNPTQWTWHPTDENFIRVVALDNGVATDGNPGRGGVINGRWAPRYLWQVWTKDGTRYEFEDDLWWGWCSAQTVSFETYKWLLTRVVDTHGNTTTYTYGRAQYVGKAQRCGAGRLLTRGTVDYDAWPTEIDWGGNAVTGLGDHFKVVFESISRGSADVQYNASDGQYGGKTGTPHETRKLQRVMVWSLPDSGWSLVRGYQMTMDTSTMPDNPSCEGVPCKRYAKLTLKRIQQIGNDQISSLPAMQLTYGAMGGSYVPAGGANRITRIDTGYGAQIAFGYQNIFDTTQQATFSNNHRVTQRVVTVNAGTSFAGSYTWSYAYGTPLYNTPATSAVLYYNTYKDTAHDWRPWLVRKENSEFRGHDVVIETQPNGAQVEHYFRQGLAACALTAKGNGLADDACFQQWRDAEFQKGDEWLTRTRTGAGATTLHETEHTFTTTFYDYGSDPYAGLWRAFVPETSTAERAYEGSTTPSVKTTTTTYGDYGNVATIDESDQIGAVVRTTSRYYLPHDDAATYLVDRMWAENVSGPLGLLSSTHRFYDGATTTQQPATIGDVTQVRSYTNIQPSCCDGSEVLTSSDTSYTYDDYGNRTTTTTYAEYGTLHNDTYSDPGNGSAAETITTNYDDTFHAWPKQVLSPTGNGITLNEQAAYDERGLLTSVIDPNTNVTTATYDAFGRPATLVKPGDDADYPTVVWYYYDTEQPVRQLIALRENAGEGYVRPLLHFFDGLGREVQTKGESAEGSQHIVTDTRYDAYGQVTQRSQPRYVNDASDGFWRYATPDSDANERWTTTAYDALERTTQVTQPDGTTTRTQYGVTQEASLDNSWVRFVDTADANRHRTQWRSDSLGRLQSVYEISGDCDSYATYPGYTCAGATTTPWAIDAKTIYGYNALDQLIGVIDQYGATTNLYYDSLGRKTQMHDPDMGTWQYDYDPQGNLKHQTDARGIQTTYIYDALNRLTDTAFSNGDPSLAYRYDESWGYGQGRRTTACVDPAAGCPILQTYIYDTRGRLQTEGIVAAGITRGLNWTYDSADRVRTIEYPNGRVLRYDYDEAWRPKSACLENIGCLAGDATYTALDQPAHMNYGIGRTETHTYDPLSARQTQLQYDDLFDRSYHYDPTGNVSSITDNLIGQTQNFAYDHRDRLTTAGTTGAATNAYNETYIYDPLGNLLTKGEHSYAYPTNGGAHPHAPDSVDGQSYSYDANGNVLAGGGRTDVTWNAVNQITSLVGADGVAESYSYDADGERITRTRNGVTTVYLAGVWEEDIGGTSRELYPFNGKTIAMLLDGDFHYLLGDHLGSVSLDVVSTGLVSQQDYTPWGEQRGADTTTGQTSLNYTGQRKDATGLLYYHSRYYDPALGRFLSPDTVVPGNASGGMNGVQLRPLTVDVHEPGFVAQLSQENQQPFWFQMSQQDQQRAGSPWGPMDPQGLNRYSYVRNNPVNRIDPKGHTAYLNQAQAAQLANDLSDLSSSITDFLKETAYAAGASGTSAGLFLKWLQEKTFTSFAANLFKGALTESILLLIRAAGPAAALGTLLLDQIADDLATIAQKVRDFSQGGGGIAIAVGGGQIGFLDRVNGNFTAWTPEGINSGFRRELLLSNIPTSWNLGARPVGDPLWWRGWHYGQDERWIPEVVAQSR